MCNWQQMYLSIVHTCRATEDGLYRTTRAQRNSRIHALHMYTIHTCVKLQASNLNTSDGHLGSISKDNSNYTNSCMLVTGAYATLTSPNSTDGIHQCTYICRQIEWFHKYTLNWVYGYDSLPVESLPIDHIAGNIGGVLNLVHWRFSENSPNAFHGKSVKCYAYQ